MYFHTAVFYSPKNYAVYAVRIALYVKLLNLEKKYDIIILLNKTVTNSSEENVQWTRSRN